MALYLMAEKETASRSMRLRTNQDTGRRGEDLAASYLRKKGYSIRDRNYRCPLGEIDIIATTRTHLVFIEVKTRSSNRYGAPGAAVDRRKQRTLSMVALHYLKEKKLTDSRCRFDVVAIDRSGPQPDIQIFENAFEVAYG